MQSERKRVLYQIEEDHFDFIIVKLNELSFIENLLNASRTQRDRKHDDGKIKPI